MRRIPSIPASLDIGAHRRRITAFGVSMSLLVIVLTAAYLPSDTSAYTTHEPIYAYSDLTLAELDCVTGSGTESQPYIIDGLEITAPAFGFAISISGTTKYLVIKNVYIHNDTETVGKGLGGIFFSNVENCTVMSSVLRNCTYAFYVDGSRDLSIQGVNVAYCDYGLSLSSSWRIQVSYSSFAKGDGSGIYCTLVNRLIIHGNNVSQFGDSAVLMESCSYSRISNNTFWMNTGTAYPGGGVSLRVSQNIWVFSNSFIDNALYQAYDDDPTGLDNYWNNTYDDGGGNYWSDHTSTDTWIGELQDIWDPDGDGIYDENYSIPVNSVDEYPLVEPIPEFDGLLVPVSAIIALFALMVSRRRRAKPGQENPLQD